MVDEVEGTSQVKQAERENVRVYIYFIYFCVLFLFSAALLPSPLIDILHTSIQTETRIRRLKLIAPSPTRLGGVYVSRNVTSNNFFAYNCNFVGFIQTYRRHVRGSAVRDHVAQSACLTLDL